jgi:hypothetical protein
MFRALGGNRPVGPACGSEYRTRPRGTQYDGVLVCRRIFGKMACLASTKSLNLRFESRRLGRMA